MHQPNPNQCRQVLGRIDVLHKTAQGTGHCVGRRRNEQCTFRLLAPTWKHPHRQRMEENAEPIVQHPTGLHPAAYRFQVRSWRRCAPGSGIGPDAPGLNAQDNGPRVEGRGRIRFRNREAPGWNAPARGPGNQASWALATSTRAENPASSWTAMSARTLRSISTSASFRPWMNWP